MALSCDALQACLLSLEQDKATVLKEIAALDLKIATARHDEHIDLHKLQVAQTKYEGKYHADGELTAAGHPKKSGREYRVQDLHAKHHHVSHQRALQEAVAKLEASLAQARRCLVSDDLVQARAADTIVKMQEPQLAEQQKQLASWLERGRNFRTPLGLSLDEAHDKAFKTETRLSAAVHDAAEAAKRSRLSLAALESKSARLGATHDDLLQREADVREALDQIRVRIKENRQQALARRAARQKALSPDHEPAPGAQTAGLMAVGAENEAETVAIGAEKEVAAVETREENTDDDMAAEEGKDVEQTAQENDHAVEKDEEEKEEAEEQPRKRGRFAKFIGLPGSSSS